MAAPWLQEIIAELAAVTTVTKSKNNDLVTDIKIGTQINSGLQAVVTTVTTVTTKKQSYPAFLVEPEKKFSTVQPANDALTIFRCWRIRHPDRDPVEVTCCPPATQAEILAHHPGAVAAEPFTPTIQKPAAPMTVNNAAMIRAWLDLIGEDNPAIIAEVMEKCQKDAGARAGFLRMAVEALPVNHLNNAVTCGECSHFKRTPNHSHLGHCAKGQPEAAAGLWDSDRRWCEHCQSTTISLKANL